MTEQSFCPFCGTAAVPGGTFCVKCGRSLAGDMSAGGAPPETVLSPAAVVPSAQSSPPVVPVGPGPAPVAPAAGPTWSAPAPAPASAPPPAYQPAPPPPAYQPAPPPPAYQPAPPPAFGTPPPPAYPAAPPPGSPGQPAFEARMRRMAGQRPMGITILVVLMAIGAVIGLWNALQTFQYANDYTAAWGDDGTGQILMLWALVIAALSVAWLAAAYGLWMLRPWAWMLTAAVAILNIAALILATFMYSGLDLVGHVIQIAINAAILIYLNTADVRAHFGRTSLMGPPRA
jgi:hypothetical protein